MTTLDHMSKRFQRHFRYAIEDPFNIGIDFPEWCAIRYLIQVHRSGRLFGMVFPNGRWLGD